MSNLFIPVILGTARAERESEDVAKFVFEIMKQTGIETELVDVREFHLEATSKALASDTSKKFKELVLKSDGFIMVVPEYNHSFPGELKIVLDQLYEAREKNAFCGFIDEIRLNILRAICEGNDVSHALEKAQEKKIRSVKRVKRSILAVKIIFFWAIIIC